MPLKTKSVYEHQFIWTITIQTINDSWTMSRLVTGVGRRRSSSSRQRSEVCNYFEYLYSNSEDESIPSTSSGFGSAVPSPQVQLETSLSTRQRHVTALSSGRSGLLLSVWR